MVAVAVVAAAVAAAATNTIDKLEDKPPTPTEHVDVAEGMLVAKPISFV